MLGRVKVDNTFLTCDKGNFNQITARSRNRARVTVVRDTCTAIVSPVSLCHNFITNAVARGKLVIKYSRNSWRVCIRFSGAAGLWNF